MPKTTAQTIRNVTRNLRQAYRHGWHRDGDDPWLLVGIEGARLLTLNEMLGCHPRQIIEYRKASHDAIRECVFLANGQTRPPRFKAPVRLFYARGGQSLVDNDAMPSMFKFMVDGLRHAGVLPEDDPSVVTEIRWQQRTTRTPFAFILVRPAVKGKKPEWPAPVRAALKEIRFAQEQCA